MKIEKLIEAVNGNKGKLLKAEQLKDFIKKTIETKPYLSIKVKKDIIENIVFESISYQDGVYMFDDIKKYICFTMKTIEAYTNLELSEDIEADYDMLCEAGLLNVVIETFVGEHDNINLLLQMKCNSILSNNSVESQLGKFLNNISDNVDSFVGVVSDKVSKLNTDKLPFDMNDLGGLLKFVNLQKK